MPDSYKELIKSNPDETEIRSFLVNGDQVSVTLRIPDTLRDAAKEEAALRGMSFSAFVRTCMIEELAKKGGINPCSPTSSTTGRASSKTTSSPT